MAGPAGSAELPLGSISGRLGLPRAAVAGAASVAAVLLAWEIVARAGWVNPWILPQPQEVLRALRAEASSGVLFSHLGHTLRHMALGFVLGSVPGIAFGLSSALLPYAFSLTEHWLNAVTAVPRIVLLPYFIFLFGAGEALCLFAVALAVFLEMTLALRSGSQSINQDIVDVVRLLGAKPRHVLTDVIAPSLFPYLLLGLQLSFRQAIRQAVVVESIFSIPGIGQKLWGSADSMRTSDYFAYILLTAALGAAILFMSKNALLASAPWFRGHGRDH